MADTEGSELFGALAGEVLCPDFYSPRGDRPHSRQYLAEFLLAVTGNAGDAEDLAGSDVQRHLVQRDIAEIVMRGDLMQAQHGLRGERGGARRASAPVVENDLVADHQLGMTLVRAIAGLFGGDLASAAKHGDAVGNFQDLVEFVADEDDGVAAGAEFAERLEQFARL